MKTIVSFLLLMPLIVFAQKNTGFVVSGSVTGFAEGTAVKLVNGNDNSDMSSAKISGGKFTMKGSV